MDPRLALRRSPRTLALALALVLATALAGCGDDPPAPQTGGSGGGSGGSGGSGGGPTTPGPVTPPSGPTGPFEVTLLGSFEMTGCSGLAVAQATNRSAVQALLPEGYEAQPLPDPVTGEPSDFAALVVDIFHCDNFTIPTAAIPNTWFGHVYTFIEYPETLTQAEDHGGTHEYQFRVFAGNDTLALLWPAAGYDTHSGSAEADLAGPLPGAGLPGLLAATSASLGDYRFDANLAQSADDRGEQVFSRYTRLADNSTLIWTGVEHLPVTHTGAGQVALATDDPFAGHGAVDAGTLAGPTVLIDGGSYLGQRLVRVIPQA